MADRRVYLHIGAHKTATSFLASNLRANRRALAAQGLVVALRSETIATPFAKEILAVIQGRHEPGDVTPAAAQSARALARRRNRDLLITNESLVNRGFRGFFRNVAGAMRHIRAVYGEFDVRVVLYVRKQPDYLESAYMQTVHLGRAATFERFLARTEAVDLSWLRVVDDIASVVGKERVAVRPFETIRDLGGDAFFREYLALCGVRNPGDFAMAEEKAGSRAANRSYSELAMRIAGKVNRLLDDAQDRKALRKFLQENFSTATHPRAELLTPEARTAIAARYAPSNRELFARYDLAAAGDRLGYY